MKTNEELKKLKSLSRDKLLAELKKERLELDKTKLAVSARKEDNFSKVHKSKKRIARIFTILNQSSGETND